MRMFGLLKGEILKINKKENKHTTADPGYACEAVTQRKRIAPATQTLSTTHMPSPQRRLARTCDLHATHVSQMTRGLGPWSLGSHVKNSFTISWGQLVEGEG